MFGSVLEKLDGWFGKSFIVASLLPVLLFGGANILMARFVFPDAMKQMLAYFASWPFAPLDFTASFLVASAIVAYFADPFVRFALKTLRGLNWPRGLEGLGVADQTVALQALEKKQSEVGDVRSRLRKNCDRLTSTLISARKKGIELGGLGQPRAIEDAKPFVSAVTSLRNRGRVVDLPALEAAVASLAKALERNCADKDKLVIIDPKSDERDESARLGALYQDLSDTVDYARSRAGVEWTEAVNERNNRFPKAALAATDLGNKYAALNGYFDSNFNIDVDFFLPIIRMILAKDKETSDSLESAQRRLDFAARSFVLVILFTAVWLVLAVFWSGSFAAIGLIGSLGLAAAIVVIELIKASFDNYSEIIRAICILKRFDVLTALHMKLPANWAAEKALWETINKQLQWGSAEATAVTYEHPPVK
jgi:hypothetical protein